MELAIRKRELSLLLLALQGPNPVMASSHMWATEEELRRIWAIDNTNQALMN